MDALELLGTLEARGAVVELDGVTLLVKPKSVLTDEIRADIRALKPQLLEILAHGERCSPSPPRPAPGADDGPPEPPPHPLAVWDGAAGVWRRSDGAAKFPTLKTLSACFPEARGEKLPIANAILEKETNHAFT